MPELDADRLKIATKIALQFQRERSQCAISGHRVGACLVAKDDEGKTAYFGGCNLEFSSSFNVHAERVALFKAISSGFRNLQAIVVTSEKEATATMCGYCRQDFMYIDAMIQVYVINPDGSVGIQETLKDTMKHPYLGRRKIEQ